MKLNSRGRACMGIGDGIVSIHGTEIARGGGACWLDDDTVIYQRTGSPYVLETYHEPTGRKTVVAAYGAHGIAAGGGRWACWGSYGVRTSTGAALSRAGLLDVSREGIIVTCPDRDTGLGADLDWPGGAQTHVPEVVANGVRCLGGVLVWVQGGRVRASGIATPATIAAPNYSPVPIKVGRDWWLLYQDGERLLLQPWGLAEGYIVHGEPTTYSPDAVLLTTNVIRVAWSATSGEGPSALRVRDISLTSGRVDVRRVVVPVPPVEPPPVPEPTPVVPPLLSEVTWLHADIRDWPTTSRVTRVKFSATETCIEHTKAGRWTDAGGVEGNPWIVAHVHGQWYAATYEWLRPGQTCKGVTAQTIGAHTKQAQILSWTPKAGELVGLGVSTLARDERRTSNERSQIVWVRWGQGEAFPGPVEPPPVDPPPVEPPPTPQPDLSARVAVLEREVAVLKGEVVVLRSDLVTLRNQVAALTEATARKFAALRVVGSTNRGWGHTHDVDLTVS